MMPKIRDLSRENVIAMMDYEMIINTFPSVKPRRAPKRDIASPDLEKRISNKNWPNFKNGGPKGRFGNCWISSPK